MRRLRAAALSEVELAMDIINQAKAHLRAQGIDQWQTGYPDRDCLERDVRTGKGYFLEEDGIPLGYLCVDFDGEPAYDHLNGTWAREEPYVVVHRLALSDAARGRGARRYGLPAGGGPVPGSGGAGNFGWTQTREIIKCSISWPSRGFSTGAPSGSTTVRKSPMKSASDRPPPLNQEQPAPTRAGCSQFSIQGYRAAIWAATLSSQLR